jgi:hypothetical protein
VVQSRRAILSADAATDSRFNASESIVDCRIRSVMCVPFVDVDGHVLGVIHVDSRDVLNGFDQADLQVLAGIAGQAAQAVEQAVAHDRRVQQEQIKRDLELAHRVQQGLLPTKPPEIEGYEVFDFYEPAHHVGGDFFAYVPLSEGRLAIVLADVSGKGVSAALVMAALSADVRYCLASERDLAKAVSLINESFLRGGWDDRFASMVVAVLDPRSHHVTLVSAGHLPVFLREASGLARLTHHNTVRILDFGMLRDLHPGTPPPMEAPADASHLAPDEPDEHPYLVMEYVQGQTLRSIVRAGPLAPPFLPLRRSAAAGLAAAGVCAD